MQQPQEYSIKLAPARYSRDVMTTLPSSERHTRLREMEVEVNSVLSGKSALATYQESLYLIIDQFLCQQLGYSMGRWEYDCETEYWGGASYLDSSLSDELLLKSEFPNGIALTWGDFNFAYSTE